MPRKQKTSLEALTEATRSVVDFSGHGAALGAAGYRVESDHPQNCDFLSRPGDSLALSPGSKGFESLLIGVAWDNQQRAHSAGGIFGRWFRKARKIGVDLDLGCLYELRDGTRGCVQAFGERFGNFEAAPYIVLSGDERTGDSAGHDEYMLVNGRQWHQIQRLLVYIYIYQGAERWSAVNPQIVVDVPGENDLYVTLSAYDDQLALCAVAEIESVRGGIKLINRTEYFPGHAEMDRAFGFGLEWQDGQKCPL